VTHHRHHNLTEHTFSHVIVPLSLHDTLPIWRQTQHPVGQVVVTRPNDDQVAIVGLRPSADRSEVRRIDSFEKPRSAVVGPRGVRSEEHTSELQSREKLVCRLLLENTKNQYKR